MPDHCCICYHQHDWMVHHDVDVSHNALEVFGLDPKGLACWNVSNAPCPTVAIAIAISHFLKLCDGSVDCEWVMVSAYDALHCLKT